MMSTAVEAPGEAPNNAASDPSSEVMTSVPNCKFPLLSSVSLIT